MRIRTFIALMAAALLLPVVLASVLALDKIREGERQAQLRGLAETARATALIVDREVQASLTALAALGNSQRLESGDLAGFHAEALLLNKPPNVWTLLLDDQGNQLVNTLAPYDSRPLPPVPRERVAQVLASGRPLVTNLTTGPVTGRPLTVAYVPARAAGGRRYIVAQAFALDHWKGTALAAGVPEGWVVAVLDSRGRFIARTRDADEWLGRVARPELVAAAAGARDGLLRQDTSDGVPSYNAFTHSAQTGWTVAVAAPVDSVEATARRAMAYALAGLGLALLAGLAVAAAFGERLISAIRQACRAAVALGHGQRPHAAASGLAEVDALHRALADAGELLDGERRSRQVAEGERERLLASETAAREAAQAQNMAKDQFLAALGHELRNPLAAISGAISLLELGGHKKERADRYLDIIRRQNRHLAHVVNDLLDVSRLLAGRIALHAVPMELAACVRAGVDTLRASDRAIGHRIELSAEPVWVRGDPARIDQVVAALVGNALKFSAPGSPVAVCVARVGAEAVVEVSDRGQGMAAELVPHVFEPFVQGPGPGRQPPEGLGIGLALVQRLVALHGGRVWADSPGEGAGSRFGFALPVALASGPGDAAPATPIAVPAPARRHRIVYVEDSEDARTTTAELLRAAGHEVYDVVDGADAIAAVRATRPDAVLMDIGLPGLDGCEVARRLRADPALAGVALIALTGYGQPQDREAALAAGFQAYLLKPVDVRQLSEAIDDAVEARGVAA